jgi:hypothetical protein
MSDKVNIVETNKEDNTPTPNPLGAMLVFFVVTSIYCVLSIFMNVVNPGDKGKTGSHLFMKIIYIFIAVLGQYFINLSLSESMCGTRQWKSSLFITIIPWLFIFGVLHLFLILFPGWLSPFSNTFGYGVAKLMGLPDLMDKILVPPNPNDKTTSALESIRSDKSLLLNELLPNEKDAEPGTGAFDKAFKKLQDSKILQNDTQLNASTPAGNGAEVLKNKLIYFVLMKNTISEYAWNLLAGFLATSVSYNYIINAGCQKSPEEMKKRYVAYGEKQKKYEADQKAKRDKEPNYVVS